MSQLCKKKNHCLSLNDSHFFFLDSSHVAGSPREIYIEDNMDGNGKNRFEEMLRI